MPAELTNKRLQEWLAITEGLDSSDPLVNRFANIAIRALLAAREEREEMERTFEARIAGWVSEIAPLRGRAVCAESQITEAIESHGRLMQERDSMGAENARLRLRLEGAEKAREQMLSNCKNAANLARVHHSQECDRLQVENTRLREALVKIGGIAPRWLSTGSYSGGETFSAFAARLQKMAADVLAATSADTATWLADKLAEARRNVYTEEDPVWRSLLARREAEAEKRGYECGWKLGTESMVQATLDVVASARKEGEIAGLRWARKQVDASSGGPYSFDAITLRDKYLRLEGELASRVGAVVAFEPSLPPDTVIPMTTDELADLLPKIARFGQAAADMTEDGNAQ